MTHVRHSIGILATWFPHNIAVIDNFVSRTCSLSGLSRLCSLMSNWTASVLNLSGKYTSWSHRPLSQVLMLHLHARCNLVSEVHHFLVVSTLAREHHPLFVTFYPSLLPSTPHDKLLGFVILAILCIFIWVYQYVTGAQTVVSWQHKSHSQMYGQWSSGSIINAIHHVNMPLEKM